MNISLELIIVDAIRHTPAKRLGDIRGLNIFTMVVQIVDSGWKVG